MVVDFYEKPGCINNTKQKKILTEKGHTLNVFSIFDETWTTERLKPFFEGKPIKEWFNYTAPRIKKGEVDPSVWTEDVAIQEMIRDNFLIKRPLIFCNGVSVSGFENDLVSALLEGADVSGMIVCPSVATGEKTACP